jgi:hypothetical protein
MKKKTGKELRSLRKPTPKRGAFSSIAVAELMKIASTLAHGRKKKKSSE